MTDHSAERQRLVDVAMTWRGTPYVDCARVKGPRGGADCLTFIVGAFEEAGLVGNVVVPRYTPDWYLHNTEELYLNGLLRHCDEVAEFEPLPGDIVVWKYGLCFAHGAIVTSWPLVLHAVRDRDVYAEDYSRCTSLLKIHEYRHLRNQPRPKKLLRLREWCS